MPMPSHSRPIPSRFGSSIPLRAHANLVFIAAVLTLAYVYVPGRPVQAQETFTGRAQVVLEAAVTEHSLAGISAAVSRKGEILWSGGAGFADIENRVPASAAMVHRIASISKPMTAAAVMQLVELNKLRLEDTLQTHIPNYPVKQWPVTVEQVLTHTSGIRHYKPGEAGTMENFGFLAKALRVFKDDPLLFEPGTGYNYTTYGYTTLGVIIENASGQKFGEYMHDRVWAPAGMDSTRLEMRGEIVPDRARGYTRSPQGELRNAPYDDLSIKYPGGGMLSTVEDLLRFSNAFWEGKLVSLATRDRMLRSAVLPDGNATEYGLGWGVGTSDTMGKAFSHSGGQAGTSTILTHYYDKGIAVAVIANVDNAGAIVRDVSNQIAEYVGASL